MGFLEKQTNKSRIYIILFWKPIRCFSPSEILLWLLISYCRVKSVMEHLDGCRDFPRLCIGWYLECHLSCTSNLLSSSCQLVVFKFKYYVLVGIGNPPGTMDMKAFLLQKFSSRERNQVTYSECNNGFLWSLSCSDQLWISSEFGGKNVTRPFACD